MKSWGDKQSARALYYGLCEALDKATIGRDGRADGLVLYLRCPVHIFWK